MSYDDGHIMQRIVSALHDANSSGTQPYDTQAEVVRIEDSTAWVHIPGGVEETPVSKTVDCRVGDIVQVRVSGGRATITGNMTAPPTDDTTAMEARSIADVAMVSADEAKLSSDMAIASASEARAIAEATGQHFWHDSNGAHVTEVTQEEWNDTTSPNYHSGFNSLFNSLGMLLRKALNNIASFTHSAVTFFDGQGNEPENVVANFGNSGVSLGKSDESHIFLESHGLTLFNEENTPLFRVSDERDPDASYTTSETFSYTGVQSSRYNLSMEATTPNYSVWHRYLDREIQSTKDVNGFVITEEIDDIYIDVPMIIVTYSTHDYSADTLAISFGDGTVPAGASTGYISGTFGSEVSASKYCSFVFGKRLMATSDYQTVVGCFNETVDGAFFIVGDGRVSGNAEGPHNALVVKGDGDTVLGGNLFLFGNVAFYNMFSCSNISHTIGSVAAGNTKTLTFSASRTGYRAIAISGWYMNGAAGLYPYMLRLNGTNIQCFVRNPTSSASSSTATVEVQVLYVRNSA